MSLHLIWKRLITTEVPLSSHPLSITLSLFPRLPFNAKPNIKVTHFCNQTAAPSTTLPDSAVFTEFLLNKCGFTEKDITKTFGRRKGLLRISTQNLEEVLELLYGCGLTTTAQVRTVFLRNPSIFFYRSDTKVKSTFNLLRTFMKEEHISKLVYSFPTIFSISDHRVKSAISLLQKLGIEGEFLPELLVRQPRLFTTPEEKVMDSFKQAEDLGVKKGSKMFSSCLRALLGVSKETIDRRLQCLRSLGFSEEQILQISRKRPLILGNSEENLKRHVDFAVKSVGLPLADLVKYTFLFTYSVERRMIPRYRVIEALKSMQVLKINICLPQVFALSERSFLEKYVNSNAESSSVLHNIYHGGKDGKLIIDKETCNKCVSVKKISGKF